MTLTPSQMLKKFYQMFKTKGAQNNCKIGTARHPIGPSWVVTRVRAYYPQNWQPFDRQVQQISLFYKS